MPRTIQSPAKRWPGTITLSDPLTFPQYIAYQKALVESREVVDRKGLQTEADLAMLGGLLACVEKFDLGGNFPKGVTRDTFPRTPQAASKKLFMALFDEVIKLTGEADDDPND